jgi:hypothetical protein
LEVYIALHIFTDVSSSQKVLFFHCHKIEIPNPIDDATFNQKCYTNTFEAFNSSFPLRFFFDILNALDIEICIYETPRKKIVVQRLLHQSHRRLFLLLLSIQNTSEFQIILLATTTAQQIALIDFILQFFVDVFSEVQTLKTIATL